MSASWLTPSAAAQWWVARAAVGDQQGVLRDHRIEGSRERRRIDPGQHRVGEFAGRHNDRPLDTIDMMGAMVQGMVGRRLTRKELVYG